MSEHQVVVVLDVTAETVLEAGIAVRDWLANERRRADYGVESWWMPEEPLRTEVDGNDNSRGWLVFECPTCGGDGELTECANDGTHGCSHTHDRTWPCTDCMGNGTVRSRTAS